LDFKYLKKFVPPKGPPLNRGAPCHGIIGILVNPALPTHNRVDLWRNLCTNLLYFVVRARCRRKKVHVRYLISWWVSCYYYVHTHKKSTRCMSRDKKVQRSAQSWQRKRANMFGLHGVVIVNAVTTKRDWQRSRHVGWLTLPMQTSSII